jgi:hypothetical protein
MKKQTETQVVAQPEAVQALRESTLMGLFLEPTSPSDAARQVGIAANLMHHHVKRYLDFDLLFETSRQDGKVFYQLCAKNFLIPWAMIPAEDQMTTSLNTVNTAFVKAYERSERLCTVRPEYHVIGFADLPEQTDSSRETIKPEPHPAHYQLRSLRLSGSSYQKVVQRLSELLNELHMENSSDAVQCSLLLLAFEGSTSDVPADVQQIQSFLPKV